MKKIFSFLSVSLIITIFYLASNAVPGAANNIPNDENAFNTNTVTICLGAGCACNGTNTAKLINSSGVVVATCVPSYNKESEQCCCFVSNIPAGNYHWALQNTQTICHGPSFYHDGGNTAHTFNCATATCGNPD